MELSRGDDDYFLFIQVIVHTARSHRKTIVQRNDDFDRIMPVCRIFFDLVVVIKHDKSLVFVLDGLVIAG